MADGTSRGIDVVLAELRRTTDRLDDATDVEERIELRDRLHRLRAEAAVLRGPALQRLSDEQLDQEIRAAQRALDGLRSQRYDPSMVAGASGRGGGLDPILTARHNQRVDEAGGRAELEERLRRCLEERSRRC